MLKFDRITQAIAFVVISLLSLTAHAQRAIPVTVANTPTVNANITNSSVTVGNTNAAPLFVDNSPTSAQGFNASCFTGNIDPTYGQAGCKLFDVPAGRRAVIETISCQAELPTGQGSGDVQLIVPSAPVGSVGVPNSVSNVSHLLTLSRQAGDASLEIWRTTTSLRAYAVAPANGSVGVGIFFRANYVANIPIGMGCAVSGYLVQ